MGAVLLLVLTVTACAPREQPAPVQRLEPSVESLDRVTIGSESRYALRGNDHRFAVTVPSGGVLELSLGVQEAALATAAGGMEAVVDFETPAGTRRVLRRTIGGSEGHLEVKQWHDFTLPLTGLEGQQGTLVLSLRGQVDDVAPVGHVVWGNPQLVPAQTRQAPNVILISIDTLRADRLGCYGSDRETSPNIDRMAREGVLFRRAVSSSSWTLPSHASMLTGLDPYHHGAIRYGSTTPLRDELDTLAEHLWRGRYETAGFVGGGFVDGALGFSQGFDRYWAQRHQSFDSFEQNAAEATRWIERRLHRPFFVFLHTYQVHMPYAPPPPYDRMFDPDYDGPLRGRVGNTDGKMLVEQPRLLQHARALYDGLVRYTDQGVGDLLDYLRVTGLDRHTCVVLTSDHGEEFLEHGDILHGRAKLYSELTHIPLIVWCPSRFAGGREVQEVVSLVDITPTILDIAGLPAPTNIQGRSLLDVLNGKPAPPGRVVVSETDGSVEGGAGTILALTTDRYRMIESRLRNAQPREVFDHVEDPDEKSNLYKTRPDLVQELTVLLKETLAARSGSPATAPQPVVLDAAQQEFLRALGYGNR